MTDVKALTAEQVLAVLAEQGTVAEAAKSLGLSERTLYRRMRVLGIKVRRIPVQEAA